MEFNDEEINKYPGLRSYLAARDFLFLEGIDYEEDGSRKYFLNNFVKNWFSCFAEHDYEMYKLLKSWNEKNPGLLVILDLKQIINNIYDLDTVLNQVISSLFDVEIDEEEDINGYLSLNNKYKLIDMLIEFGAIANEKDIEHMKKYEEVLTIVKEKIGIE